MLKILRSTATAMTATAIAVTSDGTLMAHRAACNTQRYGCNIQCYGQKKVLLSETKSVAPNPHCVIISVSGN